jgi:hypothetical protein
MPEAEAPNCLMRSKESFRPHIREAQDLFAQLQRIIQRPSAG